MGTVLPILGLGINQEFISNSLPKQIMHFNTHSFNNLLLYLLRASDLADKMAKVFFKMIYILILKRYGVDAKRVYNTEHRVPTSASLELLRFY